MMNEEEDPKAKNEKKRWVAVILRKQMQKLVTDASESSASPFLLLL